MPSLFSSVPAGHSPVAFLYHVRDDELAAAFVGRTLGVQAPKHGISAEKPQQL